MVRVYISKCTVIIRGRWTVSGCRSLPSDSSAGWRFCCMYSTSHSLESDGCWFYVSLWLMHSRHPDSGIWSWFGSTLMKISLYGCWVSLYQTRPDYQWGFSRWRIRSEVKAIIPHLLLKVKVKFSSIHIHRLKLLKLASSSVQTSLFASSGHVPF